MADHSDFLELIESRLDREQFQEHHWTGTFFDYLEMCAQNPAVAAQRLPARLRRDPRSRGGRSTSSSRRTASGTTSSATRSTTGADGIFGLDFALMSLVDFFRSAAEGYGTDKRILLLHGPVGSSKSTIARLLKKGMEQYSRSPEGALYSFSWLLDDRCEVTPSEGNPHEAQATMPTQPDARGAAAARAAAGTRRDSRSSQRALRPGTTGAALKRLRRARPLQPQDHGGPHAVLRRRLEEGHGHVQVRRIVLSEKDRVGIGTFQPKDEKNQDSTELTGDINYRKIAQYGSDSDPRAFNFDGELNIANRGVCEFIEVLKLDVAFLYDLLGASQEHTIKPKKFAQTYIDEVIIGHTNEPEYKRLQSNEMMEAFRDRTIKIDIPYNIRLDDEIKIYQKDFGPHRIKNIHIAPHTLEVAAMWAVLTRLEEPKKAGLTVLQKLKLYNGKSHPGLHRGLGQGAQGRVPPRGHGRDQPRYVQDKISNALVNPQAIEEHTVNPFMVINELEGGLTHHSLINDEELKKRYKELLSVVKDEYEDIIKGEVQRAISADEEAIKRLCANYIENVRAYTQKEKVVNKYTGKDEEPDERLMRSIEEKIDIPENRKDDFRQEIMNYIGALALDNKKFEYNTNARLYKALELKLFEDSRDTIKLKNLVSSVIDDETQQKIDVVKQRLIKQFGYNDASATDVLNYVASIFARGDERAALSQPHRVRCLSRPAPSSTMRLWAIVRSARRGP
jgi:serine protein kinase